MNGHSPTTSTASSSELHTGSATVCGTSPAREEAALLGKEAGDDLERQMYFLRGMASFHWAATILEDAVLELEGVVRPASGILNEGGELSLEAIGIKLASSRNGLVGTRASPISSALADRYSLALHSAKLKDGYLAQLQRSLIDHERYLSYFTLWEAPYNSLFDKEKRNPTGSGSSGNLPPSSSSSTPASLAYLTSHRARMAAANNNTATKNGKTVPRVDEAAAQQAQSSKLRRLAQYRTLAGRTRHTDPRLLADGPSNRSSESLDGSTGRVREPTLLTSYHPLLFVSLRSCLIHKTWLTCLCVLQSGIAFHGSIVAVAARRFHAAA